MNRHMHINIYNPIYQLKKKKKEKERKKKVLALLTCRRLNVPLRYMFILTRKELKTIKKTVFKFPPLLYRVKFSWHTMWYQLGLYEPHLCNFLELSPKETLYLKHNYNFWLVSALTMQTCFDKRAELIIFTTSLIIFCSIKSLRTQIGKLPISYFSELLNRKW